MGHKESPEHVVERSVTIAPGEREGQRRQRLNILDNVGRFAMVFTALLVSHEGNHHG